MVKSSGGGVGGAAGDGLDGRGPAGRRAMTAVMLSAALGLYCSGISYRECLYMYVRNVDLHTKKLKWICTCVRAGRTRTKSKLTHRGHACTRKSIKTKPHLDGWYSLLF